MKYPRLLLIFAGLLATPCAIAGHEDHAPEQAATAAVADDACAKQTPVAADQLLESLHPQIEAIRDTADPEERRRLLRDHLLSMSEVLDLMAHQRGGLSDAAPRTEKRSDNAGKKGTGQGMMGGKGGKGHGMPMHRGIEERLDRLQKLMEQMIEHELAEGGEEDS